MTKEGPSAIAARAEALYRDSALESVAAWKSATGGLAVGYMPIYVPRELLWSQGVLPVGLMGGGEDLEIIRGDAYYQSYICHIPGARRIVCGGRQPIAAEACFYTDDHYASFRRIAQ